MIKSSYQQPHASYLLGYNTVFFFKHLSKRLIITSLFIKGSHI